LSSHARGISKLEIRFEDKVRITYLHELGHHLGLDEDDLEERGLA
jgi:predicted Zn-dependent protease with MMP-like domain